MKNGKELLAKEREHDQKRDLFLLGHSHLVSFSDYFPRLITLSAPFISLQDALAIGAETEILRTPSAMQTE